ncbi:MAG TPA: undecaprenyl-diphosphate phosphatase, partial [Chitinispirillaceae bacterium]|nr:undecaprenyl-diphosphate phosphatase [Chitinispirillaceae bacterium]
ALLQFMKIDNINMSFTTMGLGFLTSLIIGIFALRLLLKFVNQGKLHYFGFYCVVAGLVSLIVL